MSIKRRFTAQLITQSQSVVINGATVFLWTLFWGSSRGQDSVLSSGVHNKSALTVCVSLCLQLCVILEPMQELMSRHKTYNLSPRDCLKTCLFQKWQRMVAPPGNDPLLRLTSLLSICSKKQIWVELFPSLKSGWSEKRFSGFLSLINQDSRQEKMLALPVSANHKYTVCRRFCILTEKVT